MVFYSTIRDNHSHGTGGDYLKQVISANSELFIVSAYFTIYAYHHLKNNLDGIKHLKFLFGEPTFFKERTMVSSTKYFGKNLLVVMEVRWKNLDEIAEAMGKKKRTIIQWIRGINLPGIKDFAVLCNFLEVDPNVLLDIRVPDIEEKPRL